MTTTREAGRKRWQGVSKKERRKISAKGGKAAWSSMSKEERAKEMKRRAKVREERRRL